MLPKNKHHVIALSLYPVAIAISLFIKKAVVVFALAGVHLIEYIFIGRKVAAEFGISQLKACVCTVLYGYTWWKPIKEGNADWDYTK